MMPPEVAPLVKSLPTSAGDAGDAGDMGPFPSQEDPLEEETATHVSILAWRTPCTEEPGRLGYRVTKSQT